MNKQWKLLRENIRREILNVAPASIADALTDVILDHVAGYKDRELASLHKAVRALTERVEQLERQFTTNLVATPKEATDDTLL